MNCERRVDLMVKRWPLSRWPQPIRRPQSPLTRAPIPATIHTQGASMQIKIYNTIFSIPDIYSPGHVLSAREADALNRLRAENIRNNVRDFVARELGEEAGYSQPALQARITAYAERYKFGPVNSKELASPVDLIARQLARERVNADLASQGLDLSMTEVNQLVSELADSDELQAEARQRVDRLGSLAEASLEGLL